MRRTLFPIFVVAALAAWCPQILAQPQSIVGAAPTALAPQGVTGGVAMTAQGGGGTLLVGTQDILANNSGGPFSSFAVTSDVASQSNIVFGGNSTVFGTIGSGAIFLNLTANNAATTVNWLGTINTTTYNVGTGTVNFGSGTGTNVGAGIFTGDGTVFVPNSEFISSPVTNWTYADKLGRVIIPVGVAYGSDTRKVRDLLRAIAEAHPVVLDDPAPSAMFRGFGDSALDFELRCFLSDVERAVGVTSDLCFAIDDAFREAGIEIPFPQRDLHVKALPRAPASGATPETQLENG